MGDAFSGLFGGGYKAPPAPEVDPIPVREAESEPESQAVRDAERRKLLARRGMSGTLLTSPLGVNGGTTNGGSGLLGRSL